MLAVRAPETTNEWPIDVVTVYQWRQQQLLRLRANEKLAYGAFEYYRSHPVEWINHWVDTYDPRRSGTGQARIPLILFKRQAELIEFLWACVNNEQPGLIEKTRDMGATWVCSAFSVWLWLFYPGASVGWGSRKQDLVDKLGDADSIFEKIRMIIHGIPEFFLPTGFSDSEHMHFMRIINPENGATMTGEAGTTSGAAVVN